jgi:hypothetical protein
VWECGSEERDRSRMPVLIQYLNPYEYEYAYLCIGLFFFVTHRSFF